MHLRQVLIARVCLCSGLLAIGLRAESAESDAPPTLPPRDAAGPAPVPPHLICGPNSLYQFLGLMGKPAPYDEVVRRLPVGDSGVTMLQMRDVAGALGVPCAVRRCSFEELQRCGTPAVLHVIRRRQDRDRHEGHYVVLLGCSSEAVTVLDGTTGQTINLSHRGFQRLWTGYVIIPEQPGAISGRITGLAALAVVAGVIFLALPRRARNSSPTRLEGRRSATSLTAGALALFVGADVASEAVAQTAARRADQEVDAPEQGIWRVPRNSGLNTLYLLLKMHGKDMDYRQLAQMVRSDQNRESLLSLRDAAARCGLGGMVRKCKPDELTPDWMPLIATADSRENASATFVLLLRATDRQVALIDGSTLEFHQVPQEHFRRRWTGHVLVLQSGSYASATAVTWALCILLLSGYWFGRFRARSKAPVACVGASRSAIPECVAANRRISQD